MGMLSFARRETEWVATLKSKNTELQCSVLKLRQKRVDLWVGKSMRESDLGKDRSGN